MQVAKSGSLTKILLQEKFQEFQKEFHQNNQFQVDINKKYILHLEAGYKILKLQSLS